MILICINLGLQSVGSRRVRHDWATSFSLLTFMHWRRKWQPTPVFLPGESQGQQSLVGCCLMGSHRVGYNWSDLAAAVTDYVDHPFVFLFATYTSYLVKYLLKHFIHFLNLIVFLKSLRVLHILWLPVHHQTRVLQIFPINSWLVF